MRKIRGYVTVNRCLGEYQANRNISMVQNTVLLGLRTFVSQVN